TGDARRLILAAGDRQQERLLALQAEGVLPAELDRARALDLCRRALDGRAGRRLVVAGDPGGAQGTAGGGGEGGETSLDQRNRPPAHVLFQPPGSPEVLGEADARNQRGQLGAQGRLDVDLLPGVADANVQPAGLDLRRQLEFVTAI